jgi:CRP/FNR family transcriptional regulator, cyclic AMP receptor protein
MDLAQLIADTPLLASLPSEDRIAILGNFVRRTYPRGETIFRTGDPGTHLYLIESGRVKITRVSPDGREALVAIIGQGEVFGELSLFDAGLRTADARTMEPTVLQALSHDVFRRYVLAHPEIAWQMFKILAMRLRAADETIQDVVFFDVPGRVARRLLDLAQRHGREVDGGALRIDVPITQEEIAQMIGASRESVNKALGSFIERGWVTLDERIYTVRNPEALRSRLH